MEHIVIIGNGIAGVTLARHIRKKKIQITIISSENKFFFSRTALMYVFMGHMKFEHTQPYEDQFWKKQINLVEGYVTSVEPDSKAVVLNGNEKGYDKLVLATGSVPNKKWMARAGFTRRNRILS
jgi:NADH dehydrogenase FAD-containing subunit